MQICISALFPFDTNRSTGVFVVKRLWDYGCINVQKANLKKGEMDTTVGKDIS